MWETVTVYWAQWACGLLAAGLKAGIKAVLHDRLWQAHRHYMAQGWCSLEDKKNVEYLYQPYAALGGNGTGKDAYQDIFDLPTRPPENR